MIENSNKSSQANVIEDLQTLLQYYEELEELMVKSIQINIDQFDAKLSRPEIEKRLTDLAGDHIDLDMKIFALKKRLGFVQPQKTSTEKVNGEN